MDSRTLRLLELDKVIDRLAGHAATSLGEERCRLLTPTSDPFEVARRQRETSEARRFLDHGYRVSLRGIHDIRSRVLRCGKGGDLDPADLLDVAVTLRTMRALRNAVLGHEEREERFPLLESLASRLGNHVAIAEAIERCIDIHGNVKDDASAELRSLRRRILSLTERAQQRAQALIKEEPYRSMLQEALVTLREDRYCVPVRAEYRGRFSGIVHDRSASGATVFMEPMELVELNNQVRELRLAERHEVARILRELSGQVGAAHLEVTDALHAATGLDFAFAKASYSAALNATEPVVSDELHLDLRQARHPLLTGEVVPIDVTLGDSFDTLVITGPNTGGKTVALKTVGLLSLMALCGLHLPVSEGSRLPRFQGVFADIGDEQSIEQSLSTFSSHMSQIVRILRRARRGALVLLDEIGAGTDPEEGAALAQSVLSELHRRGALTLATTHHSALKAFAYLAEGMENASVEFDPESLRPTYKLRIGLPGSSNAFAVAARLGLARSLLEHAREFLSQEKVSAEKVLAEIEHTQRRLEHEVTVAERERESVQDLRQEYEEKLAELEERERERDAQWREERARTLRSLREEAETVLRQLRAETRESRRTEELRKQLRALGESVAESPRAEPAPPPQDLENWKLGDIVRVISLGKTGTLLSLDVPAKQAEVRLGAMKVTANLSDLTRVGEGTPERTDSSVQRLRIEKSFSVPNEINLIGQRVDEALQELDKYLDDALLAEVSPVRIIHGRGTGALREAIRDFLAGHKAVQRFEAASPEDGGIGATVAYLTEPRER